MFIIYFILIFLKLTIKEKVIRSEEQLPVKLILQKHRMMSCNHIEITCNSNFTDISDRETFVIKKGFVKIITFVKAGDCCAGRG